MVDKKLISRAKKRDRKAQEKIYGIHRAQWYSICLRYQKEVNDAADALQNGLVKIFTNLDKFDAAKGDFGPWSNRIVVNENLMLLRSRSRGIITTDVDEANELVSTMENGFDRLSAKELTDLISELPVGYRTVFNMYVIDGYGHPEIAEQLGISEGTSKSQLFKARKMLRQKLEVLI